MFLQIHTKSILIKKEKKQNYKQIKKQNLMFTKLENLVERRRTNEKIQTRQKQSIYENRTSSGICNWIYGKCRSSILGVFTKYNLLGG